MANNRLDSQEHDFRRVQQQQKNQTKLDKARERLLKSVKPKARFILQRIKDDVAFLNSSERTKIEGMLRELKDIKTVPHYKIWMEKILLFAEKKMADIQHLANLSQDLNLANQTDQIRQLLSALPQDIRILQPLQPELRKHQQEMLLYAEECFQIWNDTLFYQEMQQRLQSIQQDSGPLIQANPKLGAEIIQLTRDLAEISEKLQPLVSNQGDAATRQVLLWKTLDLSLAEKYTEFYDRFAWISEQTTPDKRLLLFLDDFKQLKAEMREVKELNPSPKLAREIYQFEHHLEQLMIEIKERRAGRYGSYTLADLNQMNAGFHADIADYKARALAEQALKKKPAPHPQRAREAEFLADAVPRLIDLINNFKQAPILTVSERQALDNALNRLKPEYIRNAQDYQNIFDVVHDIFYSSRLQSKLQQINAIIEADNESILTSTDPARTHLLNADRQQKLDRIYKNFIILNKIKAEFDEGPNTPSDSLSGSLKEYTQTRINLYTNAFTVLQEKLKIRRQENSTLLEIDAELKEQINTLEQNIAGILKSLEKPRDRLEHPRHAKETLAIPCEEKYAEFSKVFRRIVRQTSRDPRIANFLDDFARLRAQFDTMKQLRPPEKLRKNILKLESSAEHMMQELEKNEDVLDVHTFESLSKAFPYRKLCEQADALELQVQTAASPASRSWGLFSKKPSQAEPEKIITPARSSSLSSKGGSEG